MHIGTGNYNGKTARIYEDYGLLTCDEQITSDVGELFNYLTGFSRHTDYAKLIVSPVSTRSEILKLINKQRDLGSAGSISMKVNGLTDPTVIDALYEASAAGVQIRLQVRTLCSLRPGVPGLSENISVKSLVGEFLEHSRVFVFGEVGSESFKVLFGSADMMERNLDRRVEVTVPIQDPALQKEIVENFEISWSDDLYTWVLGTDRRWRRLQPVNNISAQRIFKARAIQRSRELL